MLWLLLALLLYFAILAGLGVLGIKPFRIPLWMSPGAMGDPQEEVEFTSEDGVRLRAWWSDNPGADKVAVLCHGYMMNRCELVPEAHFLGNHGFSCLMLDFRAHGRSDYAPCSVGVRERFDVVAAVKFAQSRMPGAKVLLVGSSMGSAAIAFALAEQPDLAEAAVIDSAYGQLSSAISGWWRFLGGDKLSFILAPIVLLTWPYSRINPFKTDVAVALFRIGEKPILFYHGANDTLAVAAEAERNMAAAKGPKTVVWFEGCGHSEGRWLQPDLYHESMEKWLIEIGLL